MNSLTAEGETKRRGGIYLSIYYAYYCKQN